MTETTEMLKVHGYIQESELKFALPDSDLLRDFETILPGSMFPVYDASENPGVYIVEYVELTDYNEA